ncbi:MAG: PAP/fibrillin family protein [Thermaurantiacus sp.]|nr:PAP/fibrillin family protein [Thermaurantiacus sp.]
MEPALGHPFDPFRIARLKTELAALGAVTEVGFAAGGAEVARLQRLAAELEALNPTARPARAAALLRGRWHLVYASFGLLRRSTLAALSFGALPRTEVDVVEIYQETEPATGWYDNVVHLIDADGLPATLVVAGTYAVRDDRAIDIRFERALLYGERPRIERPIDPERHPPLLTRLSFLDDGFRLVRGSGGSLYVLERLDPAPMRWAREA